MNGRETRAWRKWRWLKHPLFPFLFIWKWLYFSDIEYPIWQQDFNAHTLKIVARGPDEQARKATCSPHSRINVNSLSNSSSMSLPQVAPHSYPTSDVSRGPHPAEKRDASFVLPDLNLMPSEDDLCSWTPHQISWGPSLEPNIATIKCLYMFFECQLCGCPENCWIYTHQAQYFAMIWKRPGFIETFETKTRV